MVKLGLSAKVAYIELKRFSYLTLKSLLGTCKTTCHLPAFCCCSIPFDFSPRRNSWSRKWKYSSDVSRTVQWNVWQQTCARIMQRNWCLVSCMDFMPFTKFYLCHYFIQYHWNISAHQMSPGDQGPDMEHKRAAVSNCFSKTTEVFLSLLTNYLHIYVNWYFYRDDKVMFVVNVLQYGMELVFTFTFVIYLFVVMKVSSAIMNKFWFVYSSSISLLMNAFYLLGDNTFQHHVRVEGYKKALWKALRQEY